MDAKQQEVFDEIRKHLANLHHRYSNDPNADGHHKSCEGQVSVSVCYPNWFEADCDIEKYLNTSPEVYRVEVYSYLFGPHRMHVFESLEEARDEVLQWTYERKFY